MYDLVPHTHRWMDSELLCPPVAWERQVFFYNKAFYLLSSGRFYILMIHSIVSYLGIRHGHNLPPIRGVGEDFLITSHGGIKYDFTNSLTISTKTVTLKDSSV